MPAPDCELAGTDSGPLDGFHYDNAVIHIIVSAKKSLSFGCSKWVRGTHGHRKCTEFVYMRILAVKTSATRAPSAGTCRLRERKTHVWLTGWIVQMSPRGTKCAPNELNSHCKCCCTGTVAADVLVAGVEIRLDSFFRLIRHCRFSSESPRAESLVEWMKNG